MNEIGQMMRERQIPAITINIPTSKLTDTLLRKDHIQEVFQKIGCDHHFLNATVRNDVQREDPEHVRLVDCYDGGFRKVIRSLYPEMPEGEFRIVAKELLNQLLAKYLDPLQADQEFTIEDDSLKSLDQDALKKTLKDCLLSKQGRAACSTSHLRALKWGKEQYDAGKIKAVLVTEDDIQWIGEAPRIKEIFENSMNLLQQQQEGWDVFMLGASNYIPHERKGEPNAVKVDGSDTLVRVRFSYGNYAYMVNGPSIEKVIRIMENHLSRCKEQNETIFAQDVVLSEAMEKDLRVFSSDPKLVGPMENCWSVICGDNMAYGLYDRWTLAPDK